MKRLISLVVSLGILCFVYWKIDFSKIAPVFSRCSIFWLVISLGMVVPLTMFTAWRLCQLMPKGTTLKFSEANRLILLASVLNLVLPSKMGDMAKAAFMADRGHLKGSLAFALVVFEKACDMTSLLAWCVFGLCLYPCKDAFFWAMTAGVAVGFLGLSLLLGSQSFANCVFLIFGRLLRGKMDGKVEALRGSWTAMHGYFWSNKANLARIAATSLIIWFLHLVQIWIFTIALRAAVPFLANLALSPLAILAGLLPFTFAGVGTRDAALLLLYKPYMGAPDAAALGILCTLRYVLPALGGLPFIEPALASLENLRRIKKLSKG